MTMDKFQVKIRGRLLNIDDKGLSPLELASVVNQVDEKIKELEEKTNLVDGSKLAMMAAIEFAIELYKHKPKSPK